MSYGLHPRYTPGIPRVCFRCENAGNPSVYTGSYKSYKSYKSFYPLLTRERVGTCVNMCEASVFPPASFPLLLPCLTCFQVKRKEKRLFIFLFAR